MGNSHPAIRTFIDLESGDHLCFPFEDRAEHQRLLTFYLRQGLERGEKVLCLLNSSVAELAKYFRDAQMTMEFYLASGQLRVLNTPVSFLSGKTFEPDEMIRLLETETKTALADGYSALRVTAEMSWALDEPYGLEKLVDLEIRLNAFLSHSSCIFLCQYDKNLFEPEIVQTALINHPGSIIGNQIRDNQAYRISIRKINEEVERRVQERTAELFRINKLLREEVAELKWVEEKFRQSDTSSSSDASKTAGSPDGYSLMMHAANDGMWDWNLLTNIIYFSPRWKSMLGTGEMMGNTPEDWYRLIYPEDLERVKAELTAHLGGDTPHFESEYRMLHKNGSYRWMLTRGMAIRDENGQAYRIAGSQTDITDHKMAEQQLAYDALHDSLTGLPNRLLFMDRLNGAIQRSKRRDSYLFAVLCLDLDRFKLINDSLGHSYGDHLLMAAARRLEGCLRAADSVARFGGDEFAILLDDLKDVTDVMRFSRRIHQEMKLPFLLNEHEVFTSVSIGISLSSRGYDRSEDLLRDADTALCRAKALGKGRHEIFDTNMRNRAVALLHLETDLRRAVERREFCIQYQPIVCLEDGKIHSFEALVRWQHPRRDLLYPAEFISTAEDTGLIIPIGEWVLREACQQMSLWQSQFESTPITLSVNLSVKQFSQPDLIEHIHEILRETGLPASSLTLEITESSIMENAELVQSMLSQLRALQVKLHVDDFGTGYSSLSYLDRLPLNALKIDRCFVSRIDSGTESRTDNLEIIRTIITLAHNLGLDVIAEGIETEEQLMQLRSLGCRYGQGYLFSEPVNPNLATYLIRELQEFRIPNQPKL